MINEFTAKKLGEVMAFARVGEEIFERGRAALDQVLTEHGVNLALNGFSKQLVGIGEVAAALGSTEITEAKCEKTSAKLRQMLELYVGDQWDNPAELLEWLGFFEGAAIVHWQLVAGAAGALEHVEVKALTKDSITFHDELLGQVSTSINALGAKKALM